MYLTEDEAREKWCPETRAVEGFTDSSLVAANQNADGQMHTFIASDCMMWRWRESPNPDALDRFMTGEGYCGLAGRPE